MRVPLEKPRLVPVDTGFATRCNNVFANFPPAWGADCLNHNVHPFALCDGENFLNCSLFSIVYFMGGT